MPSNKHSVLLVDDHPIVLSGLAALINDQTDLEVVGQADDSTSAMRLLGETEPQVVVVDLRLKGQSGLELVKDILAARPETRVLVVTMREEDLYAERSLRAGAHGFVNKEEAPEIILEALRRVLAGERYLSSDVSNRLFNRVITQDGETVENPVSGLSDRELEVYEAIGSGLSTQEIAQRLSLSPKTIESYREKIKAKFNFRSGSELVRHATLWHFENF